MKLRTTFHIGTAMLFLLFMSFMGGCKKNDLKDINPQAAQKSENVQIDEMKEMLTLSAISMRYHEGAREKETKQLLAMKDLATKGNWELIWYGYHDMKSVEVMIVKHKYLPNTYAIVPKGQKQNNVFSLYQGIYVFGHENFTWLPYGQKPLKIASGAHQVAETMIDLRADAPIFGIQSGTIEAMVKSMAANWDRSGDLNIYVAGHSLGGANASLLGTYVHTILSQIQNVPDKKVNLKIYNYAGPNLFEQDFVDYYNGLKKDQHINVTEKAVLIYKDIVSNYFPYNFKQMSVDYNYSTVFGYAVKAAVASFNAALDLSGEKYVPIGSAYDGSRIMLVNRQDPKRFEVTNEVSGPTDWVNNYLYNHLPNNYLVSVGAPEVPHLTHDEWWQK